MVDHKALRIDLRSEWVTMYGPTYRTAVPKGFPRIFDLAEWAAAGTTVPIETEVIEYRWQRLVVGNRVLEVYVPERFMEAWGPLVEILATEMDRAIRRERLFISYEMRRRLDELVGVKEWNWMLEFRSMVHWIEDRKL